MYSRFDFNMMMNIMTRVCFLVSKGEVLKSEPSEVLRSESEAKNDDSKASKAQLTPIQRAEKAENLRERINGEAARLGFFILL